MTNHCVMDAAECRRRLHGGPLKVAAAMAEVWFRHMEYITFHDPLAGAVVFEPTLCGYQTGLVEVELLSRHVPGMTHWNPQAQEQPHEVASTVDVDRFFAHYFEITGAGST